MSHFGEDGFRMKLNALHYIVPVSYPHYYTLRSLSSDFKTGWKLFSFDNQGMVACSWKRIGQTMIYSFAIVMDGGGLAVNGQAPSDLPPIGVANALMTQAHAQYRDFTAEVPYCFVGDACFSWCAGPR
jgi:hypothetical protein